MPNTQLWELAKGELFLFSHDRNVMFRVVELETDNRSCVTGAHIKSVAVYRNGLWVYQEGYEGNGKANPMAEVCKLYGP